MKLIALVRNRQEPCLETFSEVGAPRNSQIATAKNETKNKSKFKRQRFSIICVHVNGQLDHVRCCQREHTNLDGKIDVFVSA